jgi:hypothetical protein
MADDIIDFDAPSTQQDPTAQANIASMVSTIASLNAKAVMPDGRTLTRSEILQTLGLNPNTSPTAWLAIVGCGSNGSALLPGDLQRIAVVRVANAAAVLNRVQALGSAAAPAGEFVSGGEAPST